MLCFSEFRRLLRGGWGWSHFQEPNRMDVISRRSELTRECTAVWGPPGAGVATEPFPSAGRGWWRSPRDGSSCHSSGRSTSYNQGSWSRTRSPSLEQTHTSSSQNIKPTLWSQKSASDNQLTETRSQTTGGLYLVTNMQRSQQHHGSCGRTVDVLISGFQSIRAKESETK